MQSRGALISGAAIAVALGELPLVLDRAGVVVVVTDALAAAAFAAVAIAALGRAPWLAAAAGGAAATWLAGNGVTAIGPLHRPLLVVAVLLAFDGRLRGLPQLLVVAAAAAALFAPNHPGVNVALGVAVAAAGIYAFVHSSLVVRRQAGVAARAAVVLGVAIVGPALIRLIDPVTRDADVVLAGYATLVAITGALLFAGLVFGGPEGSGLADTVVELTETGSRDVNDVIAALHRGESDGTSSVVEVAVAEVTALLEDNRSLHAALKAQVEEVRQSRRRLVEAADVERRRLARRVAEGAGRDLAELDTTFGVLAGVSVDGSAEIVDRVIEELVSTRDDLDQLARGLHPRMLVEEGLRAALEDLARRTLVPTTVHAPDARFTPIVETTVWYVCAEATANMTKHARARTMRIDVTVESDQVVVTVADDGVGGATAGHGSGLTGLADRLDAVGGAMELRSVPGQGTELRARVPVA